MFLFGRLVLLGASLAYLVSAPGRRAFAPPPPASAAA